MPVPVTTTDSSTTTQSSAFVSWRSWLVLVFQPFAGYRNHDAAPLVSTRTSGKAVVVSVTSSELDRFTPGRAFARFKSEEDVVTTVSGSLGFVDISGFTALSERLAALGRVGAEELTEVLGLVFGEMIDLASRRGGTLLKFGGDALLLLYESDDHAVQAASAAVEMRSALRRAVEIPTSVGKVALRMSQGVHSGEIHLIRSRGVHTELVIAGPAVSHVTEMEGAADASEIVVSDATRALLPTDAVAARKGSGWLLRWRTSRTDPCGFIGMDAGMGGDPDLVPMALREHLARDVTESEHRQATVAFVEIVGIDDEIAERDVFAVSRDLSSVIAAIGSIAADEGVTFLATDVDENACKVILVSGVPVTEIDEEGRMLRTVRRIADLDSSFDVKIGVNRGHVFSGEIGSSHRATYTIMGDTVNLAARLMAAAPAGSIYTSPGVIDQARTAYEVTDVEPFRVKGKSEPVRAFALGAEVGPRERTGSGGSPFVGRDEELDRLRSLFEDARAGRGNAIVVSGPRGIGKTRLVDELQKTVNAAVLEVRAEPYGTANPYRPFRDPLRDLIGIERAPNDEMAAALVEGLRRLAPATVPFAPLIADVVHIDMEPTDETKPIDGRFRQERTADMVIDVLRAAYPDLFLLVAEDMHWADAASDELLSRILREAFNEHWIAIVTGRDIEVPDGDRMQLQPLSEHATTQLVHTLTEAAPLRPDVVTALVERSGGSPLFAEELVSAVSESGDLSSLPVSLEAVVGSQIDSLPPLPRRVLRYVSVLGRSFRVSVASDLIATQGVVLDSATRETLRAFLDDDGSDRLQFRHALVRDVAYEGLPFRRRRDLHLKAGHLILGLAGDDVEPVADILALHFFLGGDASHAWWFGTMAGQRNMEMFANAEAATQFERALDAARRLDNVDELDRRGILIKLGDVLEMSGEFEGSLNAYQRAAALTDSDPLARSEVLLKRARAKERAGSYVAALSDTTRARRLVEDHDGVSSQRQLAHILGYAALIRQAQEKPKQALVLAQAAVSTAEEIGDEEAVARAWQVMDWSFFMLGQSELAVLSTGALDIYKRLGMVDEEAALSTNLGAFAYFDGDWAKALEYYELGRSASERVGNMVDAAGAAANIGEVLVNQGRYEDAREPLTDARRIYASSGFGEGVAWADQLLGRLHGLEGDLEQAISSLEGSVDRWRSLGMDASGFEAAIPLADARCRAGDPAAGLATLDDAQSWVPADFRAHYEVSVARVRGAILDAAGRRLEAAEELRAGLASNELGGDPYEAALLALTLDRIAPDQLGAGLALEARETLRTLGVRSVPGIAL